MTFHHIIVSYIQVSSCVFSCFAVSYHLSGMSGSGRCLTRGGQTSYLNQRQSQLQNLVSHVIGGKPALWIYMTP